MPLLFRAGVLACAASLLHSAAPPEWVARSNGNAQVLLNVLAKFQPEAAAQFGVAGIDQEITDRTPGYQERYLTGVAAAEAELRKRLAAERDPLVKQDLEILLQSAHNEAKGEQLRAKLLLPYQNVLGQVYGGMRALLDDQVAAERRPAALYCRYASLPPAAKRNNMTILLLPLLPGP